MTWLMVRSTVERIRSSSAFAVHLIARAHLNGATREAKSWPHATQHFPVELHGDALAQKADPHDQAIVALPSLDDSVVAGEGPALDAHRLAGQELVVGLKRRSGELKPAQLCELRMKLVLIRDVDQVRDDVA